MVQHSEVDNTLLDSFKDYSDYTRFYHDCEIKLNTGTSFVNFVGITFYSVSGQAATALHVPAFLVGLIVMALAAAALVSTVAYWRYYELCWALAVRCREQLSPDHRSLYRQTRDKFRRDFPILSKVHYNAHHLFWILVNLCWIAVGAYIFVKGI